MLEPGGAAKIDGATQSAGTVVCQIAARSCRCCCATYLQAVALSIRTRRSVQSCWQNKNAPTGCCRLWSMRSDRVCTGHAGDAAGGVRVRGFLAPGNGRPIIEGFVTSEARAIDTCPFMPTNASPADLPRTYCRRCQMHRWTVCPACAQSTFKKQLTAAGFQLKGSGWYATDFKGGATRVGTGGCSRRTATGSGEATGPKSQDPSTRCKTPMRRRPSASSDV
jgi:hypothetical protein